MLIDLRPRSFEDIGSNASRWASSSQAVRDRNGNKSFSLEALSRSRNWSLSESNGSGESGEQGIRLQAYRPSVWSVLEASGDVLLARASYTELA